MYHQMHLLDHHRKLVENKQNELDLVEAVSKIDFPTLDFVVDINPDSPQLLR